MIKKYKYHLIVALLLIAIAYRDYNWHKIAYSQVEKDGWTKLKEKDDLSFWRVWTWFYSPKGELYYYDNDFMMFDSLIVLPVLHYKLDFPIFSRSQGYYCFDCSNSTQTFVHKKEDLEGALESRANWFNYEDVFKEKDSFSIDVFCSQYKRYFSVDAFGYEFELNPYLIMGSYKKPNAYDNGFVSELKNINPYNLTLEDSSNMKAAIKNYLVKGGKKPDVANIQNVTITYERTNLSQGHPVDLFKIGFEHLDEEYLLTGTFLKLWNPQPDSKKFFFLDDENDQ
jgi:hypothetical protein